MFVSVRNFLKRHPALLAPLVKLYGIRFRKYGCVLELHKGGEKLALRKGRHEILISLPHNYYLQGIAQEFDYFFESVVPEADGDKLVTDFSASKIHDIPELNQSFRFTFIAEGKSTNDAYLQALQIKPGDVVIDAGAYCGVTAYVFSLAVGAAGRVISIEADPNNFAALAENIGKTGAANIELVHAALWKEKGVFQFQAEGTMSSTLSQAATRSDHMVDVQAMTLDDICARYGLDRVDHVKMDIEGAEYEVVLSSTAFIDKYRPDFIIEAHSFGNKPVDVELLANFFTKHGYTMQQMPQSPGELLPLLHFTTTVPRAAAL